MIIIFLQYSEWAVVTKLYVDNNKLNIKLYYQLSVCNIFPLDPTFYQMKYQTKSTKLHAENKTHKTWR